MHFKQNLQYPEKEAVHKNRGKLWLQMLFKFCIHWVKYLADDILEYFSYFSQETGFYITSNYIKWKRFV